MIVVDSMQVYRGIPAITNQARRRPAELTGTLSVSRGWSVADHKAAAEVVIRKSRAPFVLDAGTGMYLNAIILDLDLAPKVPDELRERAESITKDADNPRRAARQKELDLAGAPERRSIWDGDLIHDTAFIYLRPEKTSLDTAISERSKKIVREGAEEALIVKDLLDSGGHVNPSVRDSIGVREMVDLVSGHISPREAEQRISTRTRRLARRQTRWFDKLLKTLEFRTDRAAITVSRTLDDPRVLNCMHDIISSW